MTIETHKRLALAFFDALNRSDVDAVINAYADDGYCQTMGHTLISGTYGKAEIARATGIIFAAFPNGIRFTILHLTAEDDRVAVEAESEGLHVSGRLYRNQYHFFMRFRDGKLVVFKEYMDTERVTEVLCGGQRPQSTLMTEQGHRRPGAPATDDLERRLQRADR